MNLHMLVAARKAVRREDSRSAKMEQRGSGRAFDAGKMLTGPARHIITDTGDLHAGSPVLEILR
jgi:hypothetical protein